MFRKEAIQAKSQKLRGDVFLVQPISFLVLGLLILSLVTFFIVVLFTGDYARSEQVSGHLVPSGGLVKIQTPRFGILKSIDVKENETIISGQVLASITVSSNHLDGSSFENVAKAALYRQEVALQTQITLEIHQLEVEMNRLKAHLEEKTFKIQALNAQVQLQQQLSEIAEDAFNEVQSLLNKGYISKEKSKFLRRQWLSQKADENFRKQDLATAKSELEQSRIRLQQLPIESKQRIVRLNSQRAELEGRKNELSGRSAYAISSTVNGKVVSISMDSIGRSVQTGQPLLTIMPADSVLQAELFVPSRAIGFVEVGQDVRLLYDAFPYQHFGSHKATITAITETILAPNETLSPFKLGEPVYRITATLEEKTIDARGKTLALQNGMSLRANIILERRSFLEWLLEPIRAVGERA